MEVITTVDARSTVVERGTAMRGTQVRIPPKPEWRRPSWGVNIGLIPLSKRRKINEFESNYYTEMIIHYGIWEIDKQNNKVLLCIFYTLYVVNEFLRSVYFILNVCWCGLDHQYVHCWVI